jgi:hypothetical protein
MEQTLVKETEITALMKILVESGIKGVLEYSDCITLNHLIERGQISHERNGIINALKENTSMSYGEIMELINKYEKMKTFLPSYSLATNLKLDKVNGLQEAVKGFERVGRNLIGIISNSKGFDVMDATGEHMIRLARVNENYEVNWSNHWVIQPEVNRWVSKAVRELKERTIW